MQRMIACALLLLRMLSLLLFRVLSGKNSFVPIPCHLLPAVLKNARLLFAAKNSKNKERKKQNVEL
jgi:hypothetical protein